MTAENTALTGISEVDELAVLKAQLAPMLDRETELKEKLKSYGRPVLEGALFRCTISESIEERLDSKRVREEMGAAWCSTRSNIVIKKTLRLAAKRAS